MDSYFKASIGPGSSSSIFRRRPRGVSDEAIQLVIERGGYIGGLVNDGNTCFMNSVLQSLASSQSLLDLLKSDQLANAEFAQAFQRLLNRLNTKHYKENHDYKTNSLLKTMTRASDKTFLMGYNQEDAQEFFQTLLVELEADLKKSAGIEDRASSSPSPPSSSSSSQPPPPPTKEAAVLRSELPSTAVLGNDQLGHLGTTYVPAALIDPNLENAENKVIPFQLITPVDGLSAERIGCLRCGEMGGMRYSVISGLGLNLPSDNYAALKLTDLLKEWQKPEIIEGVDCNRCALIYVLGYQQDQLDKLKEDEKLSTKFLVEKIEERIEQIKHELAKPIIDDEAVKNLYTKNMMQKSSKSKQIVISRPPALLPIHINRSVFDPTSFRVRKNNAMVVFPVKLDLDPFVAEPDEINTDARLPLSKKTVVEAPALEDADNDGDDDYDDYDDNQHHKSMADLVDDTPEAAEDSLSEDEDQANGKGPESDSDVASAASSTSSEITPDAPNPMANDSLTGTLVYQLRSVIVHYGTHNYGHYIAYRKYRGVWWRTSDESVDIVDESEVLDAPGVFMLFYELDSLSENVEQVGPDVEVPEKDAADYSDKDLEEIDDDEGIENEQAQAFTIANL